MKMLAEDDENVRVAYDFEENLFRFSSSDVEEMFEPLLGKTLELIRSEVERTRAAKMPHIKVLLLSNSGLSC